MRLISGIVSKEITNWQKEDRRIIKPMFSFFSRHTPKTVPVTKEGIKVKIIYSKPWRLITKQIAIDAR